MGSVTRFHVSARIGPGSSEAAFCSAYTKQCRIQTRELTRILSDLSRYFAPLNVSQNKDFNFISPVGESLKIVNSCPDMDLFSVVDSLFTISFW